MQAARAAQDPHDAPLVRRFGRSDESPGAGHRHHHARFHLLPRRQLEHLCVIVHLGAVHSNGSDSLGIRADVNDFLAGLVVEPGGAAELVGRDANFFKARRVE